MFSQYTYNANTGRRTISNSSSNQNNPQLVPMDEEFPEFHNRVRFDTETKKGSVLDVIRVMTGQLSNNCCRTLTALESSYPEISEKIERARINNKVKITKKHIFHRYQK